MEDQTSRPEPAETPEPSAKDTDSIRIGDLTVKLEYSPGGSTLQEVFAEFLIRLKSGLAP